MMNAVVHICQMGCFISHIVSQNSLVLESPHVEGLQLRGRRRAAESLRRLQLFSE